MKRSVILLLTTIILASCGGEEKQAENKAAKLDKLKKERAALDDKISKLEAEVLKDNPGQATPVTAMVLQPTRFNAYVEVQASVSGDENVNVTPQAPGVVRSVNVRSGQHVSRGQVMATLDAAAVEQQIKAQEAQLTLVKQVYEKQQKLWAQNIGSEVQLLTAKANYESTQKQYEALQAQRSMYTITSPINGTVDAVNVKVGDATAPGAMGIRVVSFDKLKVVSALGESYIGKVKQGDRVKLIFTETGDTIDTKLSYVARSVDPVSRAFNVEVWLGTNKNISPNMSCKMQIVSYANDKALTVPISAVQVLPEGHSVFVVKDGKAKSVEVKLGETSNGQVEITGGLSAGDQVITEGQSEITSGDPVAVEK
ncbi:MAG: efflux RND transporter periplasmic adaptor subunit [Chitinophagaceae bacterium]|nr:efflux RND transporter periplasmic adaptor subunit [Chitinophagaceae bacterium]MCB9044958.1 efflux RND transporter periplasmic adaptor subunit [Chitinophagales bacterium]